MNILLLLTILTKLIATPQAHIAQPDQFEARIEINLDNKVLQVSSVFDNNTSQLVNLTYRFKCKRKGSSGTSATSQSGTFQAKPWQTVMLSKTAVSVSDSDDLEMSLEVYNNGRTIATANYSFGQE